MAPLPMPENHCCKLSDNEEVKEEAISKWKIGIIDKNWRNSQFQRFFWSPNWCSPQCANDSPLRFKAISQSICFCHPTKKSHLGWSYRSSSRPRAGRRRRRKTNPNEHELACWGTKFSCQLHSCQFCCDLRVWERQKSNTLKWMFPWCGLQGQ